MFYKKVKAEGTNVWPGFVDLFSNLVIILIFVLMVLVIVYASSGKGGSRTSKKVLKQRVAELEEINAYSEEALMKRDELLNQVKNFNIELEKKIMDNDTEKATLTEELQRLNNALQASEGEIAQKDIEFIEMESKLNRALANKTAEYMEYQSIFFTEVKKALKGDRDVDVSSDRFILPTEILFDTGSAVIRPEGYTELNYIADVIKNLEEKIPADLPWVIRVDGHTDIVPIKHRVKNGAKDNLELSMMRAMAVVKYLEGRGVKLGRLIPSGFGEKYPIAKGKTPADLQQNRRIEFRLTNP